MLQEIEKIHNNAMVLLEKAQLAKITHDISLYNELMLNAFKHENEAAMKLVNEELEPSRSILFRSAANIAYNIGLFPEAERLVCLGLSGTPPEWVANELRDLYENINMSRHLQLKGIVLSEEEFQVSFTGNDVGFGFIRSEDYLPRAEALSKILQRTAQRKTQKGLYSKRIPKTISDGFMPLLSIPRAASFAVTFKIAIPGEQMTLFEEVPKKEVIKEVMECIDLLEHNQLDELKTKIDSQEYFDNFMGLCDNILPDGDSIKTIGFTYNTTNVEKQIVVKKVKEKLEISPNQANLSDRNVLVCMNKGEEVTIRGVLQVADKSNDRSEIKINSQGVLYKVRVPEGQIDDVVRPLWDKQVILKGRKHSKTIIELEIIREDAYNE